jgi:hypothetical protein
MGVAGHDAAPWLAAAPAGDGVIGQAPHASHAQVATLVAATPVAMRLRCLPDELPSEEYGSGWPSVEALVGDLRACLELNPTHGRGWAVVGCWNELCGEESVGDEAKKKATHFGAAGFLRCD